MKDGNKEMNKKNSWIWKVVCIVVIVAAIICTAVACAKKASDDAAENKFRQLAESTNKTPIATDEPESSEESSEEPTTEPKADSMKILEDMGVPIPDKEIDFAQLQEEENEDIYAWIYIPDTTIDYPVLQHPTDNAYYLNHNLDGSSGYPGCIYTEDYNGKDFADPNTVLYGHNMKAGTMFAGLHEYEDSEYLESHPYIYIYTPERLLVYEIFAVHESGDEHILYTYDGFKDKKVFENYIKDIMEMHSMGSVLKEAVEVNGDSRILTLSTCISSKPNNRFLVQGVLLNGE